MELPTPYTMDDLLEYITESHLRYDGGYPFDSIWIGDLLVVAKLNYDGATRIQTYGRHDLIKWLDEAEWFRMKLFGDPELMSQWNDELIFGETE
jgi:hypothetical protein